MGSPATIFGGASISKYPSLTRALAEALVDLAWFVEDADDDMDRDDAVKALDGVAAMVARLSDSQRAEFQQVIEEMRESETHPGRREFLEALPDFGLVE